MQIRLVGTHRFGNRIGDPHPGRHPAGAVSGGTIEIVLLHEAPIEMRRERRVLDPVRVGNVRERNGLDRHRRFRTLERTLGIQDRPDRLAGDHAPCQKTSAVAGSVDLVANRFGVITRPYEIGQDFSTQQQLGPMELCLLGVVIILANLVMELL